MKTIILTSIFTIGLFAGATTEAATCSVAWTDEDRAYLQRLYHKGLKTEITAYKRYHRAKLNSCNGDFSADFVMQVHLHNDIDLSEEKYNETMHVAGRY